MGWDGTELTMNSPSASFPLPDSLSGGRHPNYFRRAPAGLCVCFLAALLALCSTTRAAEDETGFVSLFNGRDLAGWDGKPGWWHVEDGAITAESNAEKPCSKHNYLIWRGGEPADFELRLRFKLIGGNSGVQFRSREVPDWDTSGYQADLDADDQYTGGVYEHTRGVIAPRGQNVVIAPDGHRAVTAIGDPTELRKHWNLREWNDYRIIAQGNEMTLFINGVKTASAIDQQKDRAASKGILAFQMHPGPPMKVQFKDIRIKALTNSPPSQASIPPREPTATPADQIKIMKDFKIELLYSPSKQQGSWVSMCIDPKGRLILCGQYDEGLYRVTPPPIGGNPADIKVEKIKVELSGAQGLLWAFDSLYALVSKNGKFDSGLYRVRDTNGDDQLDKVELLRPLEGGGDHGWHGLLADPEGKSIYVVAGNATKLRNPESSRVPLLWGEDHLLPRLPDARGFMTDVLAPGGCFYRVDPEGKSWQLLSSGYRNPYSASFNRYGDLITFDADMEYDMNTPWYRPTRLCLVASGSEYGWRNGSGKWPAYYHDSLPSILDIGPGSPVGMTFGYGAKFPAKYQEALYLPDWSYGRMLVAHLQSDGAAYKGETELFLNAAPLPTTAIMVNPQDGALYFVTGGWRIQTGLYRVTYVGQESTAAVPPKDPGLELRTLRRKLETFHGQADPQAISTVWPYLGHPDRFIRFAARVALEWQDPSQWREQALQEKEPGTSLTAVLALLRVSAHDAPHRTSAEPTPDPALQEKVLAALNRLNWKELNPTQQIDLLRDYAVTFTRLGPPTEESRIKLLSRLDPLFPASNRELNAELCELLSYLQSSSIAGKALELVAHAPTQEEQIEYLKALRVLREGWALELREKYFKWFLKAAGYRGGASFAGFLQMIKQDAMSTLTQSETTALKPILEAKPAVQTPSQAMQQGLTGHSFVKEWKVEDLAPKAESGLHYRGFERGRQLFGGLGCFACHRFANEGGAVGPDLTSAAGRFSPRDLLESIIDPSKTISDLYASLVITLNDGDTLTGRIVYLGTETVQVNTEMLNPSESTTINRKNIKSIIPSKISPMPTNLLDLLPEDEILDLMAYILSGGNSANAMFDSPEKLPSVKGN